jgi:K+-sensing histidine kinase KdpD
MWNNRLMPPAKPYIVIVDDELMVTTSLVTMLMLEDEAYDIAAYNNPQEALSVLSKQAYAPDVIVSDFLMPQMDGITFLKALKEIFPNTTSILLTGYADKENAIQAINEAGIYRYLEKPWDNDQLKQAIRNALERSQLLKRLQEKITDLESAQANLQMYSQHLEERVTEKTADLSKALEKLNAIVENTGDAIVTVNPNGEIQGQNPTFSRWVGPSTDGKNITHVLHFVDEKPCFSSLLEPSALFEAKIGGLQIEVNCSAYQEGAVLVCRDITKRKEAERLREDFVQTLTHDLRTPLLAEIQSAEFFLDGTMGAIAPKQNEMLAIMKQNSQQMLDMVNTLLDVYRYEAKQQRFVFSTGDLGELAQAALQELMPLALAKKQHFAWSEQREITSVPLDKPILKRVMINMMANAIKYTPEAGRIEIAVYINPDNKACFEVRDNGRGIPADTLPTLFERFAQGTSKHRTTGTGLGLYLSRQIVESHEGKVYASSTEGQGSIFGFHLDRI